MPIVWLASYPKSGNTFLRALLTAYEEDNGATPDINALQGPAIATERQLFDEVTGLTSSDMSENAIAVCRAGFHAALGQATSETVYIKTHLAFAMTPGAPPLFPASGARAAVYLVRNPLDVAASYARHDDTTPERIVARMNDAAFSAGNWQNAIHHGLPERLGRWSDHVTGWCDQTANPP